MAHRIHSLAGRYVTIVALAWVVNVARGQVQITEIMVNPDGNDGPWEWVEVWNSSAADVDLNGWIFQDDDGAHIVLPNTSNIKSAGGNTTLLPAGGVAVLYPGDALGFMPERFRAAWGQGITLIGVDSFGNGLANDDDAIGLWSSHADYTADALPGTMSPRRTFAHAVSTISYAPANGYPPIAAGKSIAWNGIGSPTTAANWVSSANGALGAHVSVQTTLAGAAINDVADRGTPGVVPGGGAASGLLITEVMYDPASPEPAWEWVEVFNNTGVTIDFGTTKYVFDDDDESSLTTENVRTGTIAHGMTGVLFNAAPVGGNTLANMQAAWGSSVNFIPVTAWTDLTNTGDTIALWSSLAAYQGETQSMTQPRRTTNDVAAVLAYDDDTMPGWPANNDAASIFLSNLTSNPATPASWLRSNNTNSVAPQPVLAEVIDHLGNDTGSPGFVPGVSMTLQGDYSGNGVVDAADYVLWRHAMQTSTPLPRDTTPDSVSTADYELWRANFGRTGISGPAQSSVTVPEPASGVMVLGMAGAFIVGRTILSVSRKR